MSSTQDYVPVATNSYQPVDSSNDLKERDEYDGLPVRNQGRGRRGPLGSPRLRWPLLVIIGQGVILVFGWAFFIVTSLKPLPFNDKRAASLRDSGQAITMVTTFIASLISSVTGYLFSHAIRYALTAALSGPNPPSLYLVSSSIRLSQKSLIKNFVRWQWTLVGFICFFIFRWQTASWSTLLTPRRIELSNPMSGFELDLSSPDFMDIFQREKNNIVPDLRANVVSQVISSGTSAVSSWLGMPTLFNFDSFAYVGSGTYGILPANYYSLPSAISFNGSYPVNTHLEHLERNPPGYPRRYNARQQGLTANVTCALRDTSSFNISVNVEPLSIPDAYNVTLVRVKSRCPNDTQERQWDPVIASRNGDYFFSVPCFILEPGTSGGATPQGHWEIANFGGGIYTRLGTSVCTLDSYITTLNVEYRQSEAFGNSRSNLFSSPPPNYINATEPVTIVESGLLSVYPVAALTRAVAVAQSASGNVVANSLASFIQNLDSGLNMTVLENYIRGVAEFSGTLLRAAYTVDDNSLFNGASVIPQSMRRATNGTFFVETFGWYQDINVSPAIMIAPTLIMLASIICVVYPLVKIAKDDDQPDVQMYFDAGDVLQVVAATANGDLRRTALAPFDQNSSRAANNIYVRLRPNVPGGDRVGLFAA